jgi:xanthine dehydrogenase small subunit
MNASTPRPIRFFHQGRVAEVGPEVPATRSVLQWLREDRRCTGTKEGCAEGDCGACTVVLGTLDDDGGLKLEPVNACIQFLPALDGKALFTVEDVGTPQAPHPVQRAMVECHGSQCGFCTPGFVMSLWAYWQQHRAAGTRPTRQQLADTLAGNLCRCTGYRPILDAGERMFAIDGPALDEAPVRAALQALAADPPLARPGYCAPRTLDELAAARLAQPESLLLAGSTDIGLWVTKKLQTLPMLIATGAVAGMRRIEAAVVDGRPALSIGAAASLEAAWAALAVHWPALTEMWLRFASPPIRHAGTLGGNIANGSPIGDGAPVLMALDAVLLLRRGERVRRVPLEAFYLGYMVNALEPGEFVQALEVPLPAPGNATAVRAYKISKRFDSDISAVSLGAAVTLGADGHIADLRLAWGGLAATVKRAGRAESALRGRPWDGAALADAQAALAQDFTPLTDHRASAAYRLQVAQNLLRRLWLETRPVDPLPAAAVSVYARPEAGPLVMARPEVTA